MLRASVRGQANTQTRQPGQNPHGVSRMSRLPNPESSEPDTLMIHRRIARSPRAASGAVGLNVVMRPGAGVLSAALFGLGAGLTDLVGVSKAESAVLGLALATLGVVQLGVVGVQLYWWISRSSGLLLGPAVWVAEDRLVGFTDVVGALLRLIAGVLFLVAGARGARLAGRTCRSGVADYPAQGRGYTGPSAILGKLVAWSHPRSPNSWSNDSRQREHRPG
ncbi:MAG: hypothetical protein M3069_31375 [Chloroflexota bacterium]|nr:hypothetical protein [Chloroflexota bacterium]